MKYVKKETEETKKEKFDLNECFTLWLNTSKEGNKYLTGYDFNKNRIIGFYNKKANDKQPSIRIYGVDEEGKTTAEEIITLWDTTFKTSGKDGLSGYTNEKENIIAFYGDETDTKRPYIKGYFAKN
ncbi:MAG: hypothetical protein J6S85_04615 [Methanobrevibacter sp.]|nr:hypothetical protein [Methanobrevibacter sp.]